MSTERLVVAPNPGTNADAVATITNDDGKSTRIAGLDLSYDVTPTAGQGFLVFEVDAVELFRVAITEAGWGPRVYSPPLQVAEDSAAEVKVKLTAGGDGVTGYLAVQVAEPA